ncbi:ABC transporter ATP-binding protein [Saccharothrix longispora]|uniref:ABC transporter ATP-binding protein n=1 Tax=Saccharothrix longispora TaxID=33920 RepID=UPI0028FD3FE5|nr:ABC transporter ATP-binding protein [Saccharothrix longispora]MBY8847866.1 ABC transporter ATP-binding protein/permease [Saccharothrix sp. MB29]MDU0287594.1 ABC transporter ATP-binding protein [Saccharothrix longispora]
MTGIGNRSWVRAAREQWAARRDIARLLPRAGGPLVAASVGVNLLLGCLPVVFTVATAMVLGRVPAAVDAGLDSGAWDSLVAVFGVAAGAFVARQLLSPVERALGELTARRVDGLVFDELMAASLRGPGLGPLEDQRALDALRTAAREVEFGVQSPGRAAAGLLALIARYTELTGQAVAVGVVFSWPAAAALVVTVLLFRHGQRGGLRRYARSRSLLAAEQREIDYLRELAGGAAAGKEIRVFGLAGWLRERLRDAHLRFLAPLWAERRAIYLWPFVRLAVVGLAVTGAVFAALGATAHGMTLTGFVLVATATLSLLRLAEHYPEADLPTAIGMRAHDAVRRFAEHVDAHVEAHVEAPGPAPRRAVPEPVGAIRFERVGFRYPGRRRAVFDGLDLTIPVGRRTAVVGVNGAGKTTLVKLLTRLYEPTSGRITLDGVDIRAFPVDEWRAGIGVIFQDFVRYESSVADNVGPGAVDALDDRATIREVVDSVGLTDAVARLPKGLDTPLARHLTGGAELSGGQWQRVALARALFALRHGARVVVLDEPTASLDVRAEAGFFEEFADLAEGATTLLISHRFSTVRHADVIVVLEHGRVTEQGGHAELLARGGRYAELFRLQADRFVDAVEGSVR